MKILVKLFEHYFGNTALTDIQAEIGFGRIDRFEELPRKLSRRA